MKKNSTVITLIFTALIVIIGIWGYYSIIRPMYLNNLNQTKEISFENSEKVEFVKYENQGNVFGIELEVSGKTASNFDLIISTGSEDLHAAMVKGGDNVDFVYKNDWYNDTCIIEVISHDGSKGTLNFNCRFLALEKE